MACMQFGVSSVSKRGIICIVRPFQNANLDLQKAKKKTIIHKYKGVFSWQSVKRI